MDSNLQIENKKDDFDKSMQEYASIIKYKDFYYMFYNGNNYGEKGIGLAKINKKEILK